MTVTRTKFRALLLACGTFWGIPLISSCWHSCPNSPDSECCGMCRPPTAFLVNFSHAHAGEPKAQPKLPPLSKETKATLEQLLEGNRRFAAGKPLHQHTSLAWRAQIAKEQKPFATILGCADSRVAPELIFDQGLGDLFVVRVAGNVVNTDVNGSLEYAALHLHTRLIVVLGHEQCGAVSAVVAAAEESTEPPGLQKLLQRIRPALKGINPQLPKEKRIAAAVEANVRWSMTQLATIPEHNKALAEGKVALVGAVYELETGKVRVLE
jgi:carbonic anhydrase